jgi:hypothetical protein
MDAVEAYLFDDWYPADRQNIADKTHVRSSLPGDRVGAGVG